MGAGLRVVGTRHLELEYDAYSLVHGAIARLSRRPSALFDALTGKKRELFSQGGKAVHHGTLLAAASKDGHLRLWKREHDAFTPILVHRCAREPLAVEFSADGKELMFLVRGEYAIRIWSIDALRTDLGKLNLDW